MRAPYIDHLCMIAKRQRVLWVGRNASQARNMITSIQAAKIPGSRVRVSNGQEHAKFNEGGTLTVTTIHRGIDWTRGHTFDHVFLDSHHYLDNEEFRGALAPCFANGERYSVIG